MTVLNILGYLFLNKQNSYAALNTVPEYQLWIEVRYQL